ncbi:MAG: 16S rRNA (adenine(1518)-N(6)/adenine(1519)-N(6))-dimethyltransferase RsmA [Wenzhouxiangella sp.]|nr:MAG: 16S rRNA (adenine(1518)-N(6)/adenine(1519)-N(6))-dimethyltransferase RsmA [Wenzhouxiangella sp.]
MSAHRPRKRFGQHFLRDRQVIDRIVAAIDPRPGQRLVEIGPGEGVLTAPVLVRAGRLEVVELDRDLATTLAGRLGNPEGLTIHQADALKFDFAALADQGPLRVIGNLPYNISTPLIFHLLSQAGVISDMLFMLQKEVVDRLVAPAGSSAYGRLSVMAGHYCTMNRLFDVPPEAFYPPPKVDSAIIRMLPKTLDAGETALLPALERVVRTSFGQRRKTLRKSLKGLLDEADFATANIDPTARPETLTLTQFRALAATLEPDPVNRNP